MTVQTETSISGPYAGAGTTGPFTVGFRFLADSHLQVIRTSAAGVDTTLTLTTDYTVSGAGGTSGTVTLVTALAVGESLTIARDVPFTQLADYVNNDAFPAESHEDALDLLTMQAQQLKSLGDRSLSLPITATGVSTELPAPEASTIIGWSASGDALENVPLSSLATAIAATTWRTDVFNGTGALTAFTLTQNPGSTFAVFCSVGGVVQVPNVNFSISGTTLTFLTGAPPSGTGNVVVQYGQSLPSSSSVDLSLATGTLGVLNGGTGATTASGARTALGLVIGTDVQAYDANTAKLNAAQTFTATQTPSNDTASVSTTSTYTFNGSAQVREVTLTNAITVTFGAPSGIVEDAMYVFKLKAGDTSARTFAWNAAYKFPAATAPLTSGTTTNGSKDVITFIGGPSNTLEYVGHQADIR